MKTQYTLTPIKRLILVLTGSAGIASVMFFKDVSLLTNWFALAAIIPLISGFLGENLILAIFSAPSTYATKYHLNHNSTSPTYLSVPATNDTMEKRAA